MDFSNHLMNALFIIGTFVVFAISVFALIKAIKSNNAALMVISGAFVCLMIVGTTLFWSDGYIRTTMSEKIKSLFSSSAAVAASVSPNVRVDVPNQAPPAVVVAPEEIAPETAAPSETEPTPISDRTEMFDLGSNVAGHFPDGTPYKVHIVESGDTIYNIRTQNNLSESELLDRNPDLDIRRPIIIGQQVKIPL